MAQSTASLVSTDDASINAASTGSTGNWGDVEVYGKPGGGIVGIFKFALPTSAGGAHVTSASLRLWVVSIHNGGGMFSVHAASGSWSESSVTYGNGPSKGALLTTVSITSANQFYDIDVTAHIASRMTASASTATIWIEGGTDYKKFECHSRRDDRTNPPTLSVATSSTPSGGCERPVVSSSPPPGPTVVLACTHSCMGTTCEAVHNLPCTHLARAGCSCGTCCDATYTVPPPNTCGAGLEWNNATLTCEISCNSDGARQLSERTPTAASEPLFGEPVPQ